MEGAIRRKRGRRETTMASTAKRGGGEESEGLHPWRTPPTTTRSTAPLPPYRVLLILTPKTTPRTTMTKRGAWWEYLCSGYAQ